MKSINASDIANMEQRKRANFINSLSGFKGANLIGTTSVDGIDNLAVVSSVFHIGANPPLLGMIMRPHTVVRDTLQNIKQTGEYTINHIGREIVEQAHHSSARFDSNQSEFTELGLTVLASEHVKAPYVAESNIRLGMQVQDIQLLAINQTELVIGQIVEVQTDSNWLSEDGYLDIEAAGSMAISGLDSYHSTQRFGRYAYAKPNEKVRKIDVVSGK
ncbi:flavin reductase [Glaciecola sp. MH2013]|uniref:flavin reductase family protein n=1 Tax=Glaciecola sp. MH2013 TaxID=2785524 RepID=UPI00189E1AC5|nr:flavin reductase [Glaciecola sp. MH2013]MBF7074533.1 flavin reductase [Glaciecola sp. MH2013]